ncbi:cytochrome P450 [Bacillus sp. Cr_A10]|uniref:cytochrome P450 n=1 Tax=Bacillus sp. Cr_A10 TaxID=3033993 RepID=UPI0023DCD75A|nr:cytochrome P450 [Bacillus sp. Cr_A10]MDF2067756.1 cytochrome P450 [Bacillus sp. Cr_A10]
MMNSNQMPREEGIDHSLSFLREGYLYIPNRRKSFSSNVYETRLLGQKAICIGGKEAAEIFYDDEKFLRNGVAPKRVQKTLFGVGGVQSLDNEAHRHRKEMFMSLMTPDKLEELKNITKKQWENAVNKWELTDEVILYEESKEILCRTACEWAGVPLKEEEVKERTIQLGLLFESPTAIGQKHWKGRHARKNLEEWVAGLIEQVREGQLKPKEGSALHTISIHQDLKGELLDIEIAAVEVVNIIRPIVAIAIYINFTALAIHHHPEERGKLKVANNQYAQMFVQEVRRYYPFFPLVAAKVKNEFVWNGYTFEKGTLTLLDLYGTNHDAELWDNAEVFNPERFSNWKGSPFNFIPQGGGDYLLGHRCAGEFVTIEVMKVTLDYLVNKFKYDLPEQDLSYSMVSMPSIPHSKIILTNVERI